MTPFLQQAIAEMLSAPAADSCAECGFAWAMPVAAARAHIRGAPERLATQLEGRDGTQRPDRVVWSPSAYVWHVVDLVRAWSERLYALGVDPSAGWAGFDPDELARVRGYADLPQASGPWALARAVEGFEAALEGLDEDTGFTHPEWGIGTVADAVRWIAHEVVHHELDVRRGLG